MPRPGTHIYRVGVTGGIGSGKSLVCRFFEEHGVPVLSADEIAKDIANKDASVKRRLQKLLGHQAYGGDGLLDRAYVAEKIFSRKSLQKAVHAVIHPVVIREIGARCRAMRDRGTRLVLIEAALIYESGLDRQLDAVIVVDADEDVRIRRVMERDGSSVDEVRKRMEAQWAPARKTQKGDFVLRNNGNIDELRDRVQFLLQILQHLTPQ